MRDLPVWAQVAAALLVLGVSAGIANLDVRYDQSGLTIRTGWSPDAACARSRRRPAAGTARRRQPPAAPWRADLRRSNASCGRNSAASTPAAPTALAARRAMPRPRPTRSCCGGCARCSRTANASSGTSWRCGSPRSSREFDTKRETDLANIDCNLKTIQSDTGVESGDGSSSGGSTSTRSSRSSHARSRSRNVQNVRTVMGDMTGQKSRSGRSAVSGKVVAVIASLALAWRSRRRARRAPRSRRRSRRGPRAAAESAGAAAGRAAAVSDRHHGAGARERRGARRQRLARSAAGGRCRRRRCCSTTPACVGYRLDGYGIFFDVDVPSLETTLFVGVADARSERSRAGERARSQLKAHIEASRRRQSRAGVEAHRAAGRSARASGRTTAGSDRRVRPDGCPDRPRSRRTRPCRRTPPIRFSSIRKRSIAPKWCRSVIDAHARSQRGARPRARTSG